MCFPLIAVAAPARPDLNGRVVDPDGKPIAGATAYVYTAGVRTGTSSYCPSCYADCGKKAVTHADGTFALPALDPELVFRILVAAEGHKPAFVTKVDPVALAGKPIEATLTALPKDLDPQLVLKGRVLDARGNPVVGAAVSPFGCKVGDRRWWGTTDQIDAMSVTNAKGEFLLSCTTPTEAIDVQVEARGLATKNFALLPVGGKSHDLTLGDGATVTGRLVGKDGKPLSNVDVGLVQVDRGCEVFVGPRTIGTDADGRFTFGNVGPTSEFFVYGIMSSLKERGAVSIKSVAVGADGTTTDAGNLSVGPSFTVAGRVVLSDGKPVPPDTRVIVGREEAWDSQTMIVAADGRFAAAGVPGERLRVSVRVPGYRLSRKNVSVDVLNGCGALDGVVDRDIPDLTLQLEPGKIEFPETEAARREAGEAYNANKTRRLQGVPAEPVSLAAPAGDRIPS